MEHRFIGSSIRTHRPILDERRTSSPGHSVRRHDKPPSAHIRQYVRLTHGSQLAASAPRRPLGLLSTRGGSPVDAWGSPTRSTGSEDGSRPSAPNRRLTTSNAQQPDTSRHQPLIHPCPSIDVCRVGRWGCGCGGIGFHCDSSPLGHAAGVVRWLTGPHLVRETMRNRANR